MGFAKVVNALGCTVAGLQDASKLVPLLSSLGARHISYGVSYEFWPALGKAINRTLQDLLGEAFTPEVENAWNIVYGFMSQIMVESLRKAREEAAAEGGNAMPLSSCSTTELPEDHLVSARSRDICVEIDSVSEQQGGHEDEARC